MDRDHRLDAPDNEALRTIEQLDDRSALTTIYPHAHSAWEGTDLMSAKDREQKRTQEQLKISLAIRKWFAVIGVLVPLPAILLLLAIIGASSFISIKSLIFLLIPIVLGIGLIGFVTYWSIKRIRTIFYSHAVKAAPFIIILVGLIALSIDSTFLMTQPLHNGVIFHDALIISAAVLAVSVILSGILMLIWASPRLTSGAKLGCIGIVVVAIFLGTAALYLF